MLKRKSIVCGVWAMCTYGNNYIAQVQVARALFVMLCYVFI